MGSIVVHQALQQRMKRGTLFYCMGEDAKDMLSVDIKNESYTTVLTKLDDSFNKRKNTILVSICSVEGKMSTSLAEDCAYGGLQ